MTYFFFKQTLAKYVSEYYLLGSFSNLGGDGSLVAAWYGLFYSTLVLILEVKYNLCGHQRHTTLTALLYGLV